MASISPFGVLYFIILHVEPSAESLINVPEGWTVNVRSITESTNAGCGIGCDVTIGIGSTAGIVTGSGCCTVTKGMNLTNPFALLMHPLDRHAVNCVCEGASCFYISTYPPLLTQENILRSPNTDPKTTVLHTPLDASLLIMHGILFITHAGDNCPINGRLLFTGVDTGDCVAGG